MPQQCKAEAERGQHQIAARAATRATQPIAAGNLSKNGSLTESVDGKQLLELRSRPRRFRSHGSDVQRDGRVEEDPEAMWVRDRRLWRIVGLRAPALDGVDVGIPHVDRHRLDAHEAKTIDSSVDPCIDDLRGDGSLAVSGAESIERLLNGKN